MPSELVQGTWTTSTLRTQAETWGSQLHAAGVNLNLAPVMDVVPAATAATNAPIGALDREFGSDPQTNGEHGVAFIDGMAPAGVASVAKHFPGLGRVTGNTDFTSNVADSVTTATDPYLNSYRDAINAGVPYMMVAEATYTQIDPSHLAVFSPVIMRLLRNGLGFNGVIVSDDLGSAEAVASIPAGQRAIDFLDAGGDLITSQSIAPAEQMAATVLSWRPRTPLPCNRRRRRAPGARRQAGARAAALLMLSARMAQCAQPVAATYCCGVIRYSGTMSGLLSTRSNTHRRLT